MQQEQTVSRLQGGGRAGGAHSEVRDALEDLAKETVGATELTEDYYTYGDSCHTHAHTHLEHNVCECECAEVVYNATIQAMWTQCITTSGTAAHLVTPLHLHTNNSVLIPL